MISQTQSKQKIAVVTGASKGIGKSLAILLQQAKYHVIGTSRHPELLQEEEKIPGVEYFALDLLNKQSIDGFLSKISEIDLLINNAGSSQIGPIEDIPFEKVEEYFSMSLLAVIQITQALIPLMREQKSGKIVTITSMASRSPVPFSTFYAAAKVALNIFTRGLRSELKPYGITAVAVAPGPVHTDITQDRQISPNSPYSDEMKAAQTVRDHSIQSGVSPDYIAQRVIKILQKKHPRPYYPIGRAARIINFLMRHLPEKWAEKLVWKKYHIY